MRDWDSRAFITALILLCYQGRGADALPWLEEHRVRQVSLPASTTERSGFTAMPPEVTGLRFTNQLQGDLSLTNAVAHNGAGVAVGDVDGDGWPDLYFCNLQGPNRLYRNLGQWKFQEVPLADAACADQLSTGAVFADVEGDGDLDLLVNGIAAGTRLFLNDGKGVLTELRESGLSLSASPTSMALADIDGDGDLDLYCTHYIDVMHLADPTMRYALAREDGKWRVTKVNGQPASSPYWKDRFEALPDGRVRELPEVDGFYRNDGHAHFTAIQNEPGVFMDAAGTPIPPYRDWGLSVMFRDLNGDGAPDIYICNDNASPDRCWINNGKGRFRATAPFTFRHTSRSSMALDFADVDRDGHDDLLVLDMLARSPSRRMRQLMRDYPDPGANELVDEVPRYNRNVLFLGREDGSFAEAAFMAGVAATDWSWCAAFLDVDLDGFEDLLITNGFEFDVMDQDSHDQLRTAKLTSDQRKRIRQFHPSWHTENIAFRNQRDGTFEAVGGAWGFNKVGVSCGMALGDLDQDGDFDVVVNNLNDGAGLYRNEATAGRIAVHLKGLPPNTSGIGARVCLGGGAVAQSQEMISGGRYMSGDEAVRVFAAEGTGNPLLQLEVTWRNGDRTTNVVRPNTICEMVQPKPGAPAPPTSRAGMALKGFIDVSSRLSHAHAENGFDDWMAQPTLPRRLSRLGPGLAWVDLNDDGWEDLVISPATGGQLSVFLNEEGRSFHRLDASFVSSGDQGAVVSWADGKGHLKLLAALSNFEMRSEAGSSVAVYSWTNLTAVSSLSAPLLVSAGKPSLGPLALADVDGDGDLDLFLGGRFQPKRYPEPASSAIWLNEAGLLRPSAPLSAPFNSIGLVSGATFCDLDGDGLSDLALALEWGPLRVFRNVRGHFEDMTVAWGFASRPGLWSSIVAGDFDGDGRLDLAAGNWGRNSPYELDHPTALGLFYEDWNGDGTIEIVEAWQSGDTWFPLRNRKWLTRGFPDLPQRFPTHEAFGKATVQEILAGRPLPMRSLKITCLESAVFLNRGSTFQTLPLPRIAQLAPLFAINTGDVDGDGVEDLFLSQNFFGTGSDMSREDAGRGQWLRGLGDGNFTPLESGVKLYGEQRAAGLADFNHDGRIDVAITQNNGFTKLYLNEFARRGLRVILHGPRGNPSGVGAQLRLRYPDGHQGPCRTIQAGSGYWSQDSSVQVLGRSGNPQALWVRWPGGQDQTVPVKENQWEIHVTVENEVQ